MNRNSEEENDSSINIIKYHNDPNFDGLTKSSDKVDKIYFNGIVNRSASNSRTCTPSLPKTPSPSLELFNGRDHVNHQSVNSIGTGGGKQLNEISSQNAKARGTMKLCSSNLIDNITSSAMDHNELYKSESICNPQRLFSINLNDTLENDTNEVIELSHIDIIQPLNNESITSSPLNVHISLDNSSASPIIGSESLRVESESERLAREEKESEMLAWEMMQQENYELYQLQMQFMRENAELMAEDDFNALQSAINESGRLDMVMNNNNNVDNDADEEDEEEDNPENWDYDRLLQIGQEIGDVKTERWRLRAKSVIASLPKITYQTILEENEIIKNSETVVNERPIQSNEFPSKRACTREVDSRCAVCMENFVSEDNLSLLPCQHYFHIDCTEGWLTDHNSCPMCKTKATQSP
eukprot:gene5352-7425_t